MAVSPHARQLILDHLAASETQLLAELGNLTPSQWHFRESLDRWSIADNLEHLILFEAFIRDAVRRTLEAPATSEKSQKAVEKEALVLDLANSRATPFSARDAVRPSGANPDPAAMVADFRATRAKTVAFATETQADLRLHFFPHIAFGALDCYQWLLVLGQHALRHCRQIEQIKTDRSFPNGRHG